MSPLVIRSWIWSASPFGWLRHRKVVFAGTSSAVCWSCTISSCHLADEQIYINFTCTLRQNTWTKIRNCGSGVCGIWDAYYRKSSARLRDVTFSLQHRYKVRDCLKFTGWSSSSLTFFTKWCLKVISQQALLRLLDSYCVFAQYSTSPNFAKNTCLNWRNTTNQWLTASYEWLDCQDSIEGALFADNRCWTTHTDTDCMCSYYYTLFSYLYMFYMIYLLYYMI